MTLTRYGKLRSYVSENFSPTTQALVDKALSYASERMEGYSRYDGTPLLDHDVEVGMIVVREIGLGRNSLIASILHDVMRIYCAEHPEQVEALSAEIRREFGPEVLGIIVGLCKISNIRLKISKEQVEDFRDMIVSYSEDPRVILLKIADRVEVMRSLEMFPVEKRRKKSWESLNLYAQIAHKLGLYALKSELEDLALRWLEPKAYDHILRKLEETESERQTFISRFLEPITSRLDSLKMEYHIKSRTKSVYSIWNKMRKQGVPFEGVFDIFALRIIIDCEPADEKRLCWTTYSVVSDCYTPNPERMRDWITIPKKNGYESLHTTVSAGEGRWVEIQIRTERMDAVAERGIAAHWRYKGVQQGGQTSEQWLSRLREALEETTHSLSQRFDSKPSSGEIFVFTPNGDIRKLPEGATVLDFAFDIHTSLGSTCTGGRVNGKAAPIREVLNNGDIVEVMTQKNQQPKADWLTFCVTTKARNRIKQVLRAEEQKFARIGREELERKLKNWKITVSIDEAVAYLGRQLKIRTGREVYSAIATEKIDFLDIKEMLLHWTSGKADEERRVAAAEAEQLKAEQKMEREQSVPRSSDALIIDEKINNLEYKLARCCNPIKGDDIFGFVTVAAGITIHRTDCPNAQRLKENYPYRVMEAQWRQSADGAFRATIAIMAHDTSGLAAQVTELITRDMKLNIRMLNFSSRGDGTVAGTVSVEVTSASQVDTLIAALQRIKGVQKAYRTNK